MGFKWDRDTMGHPPAYTAAQMRIKNPHPEFIECNGVQVVAKPEGVPVKWRPVYHELASRMIQGQLEFTIEVRGRRVVCLVRTLPFTSHNEWIEYDQPDEALIAAKKRRLRKKAS